MTYNDRLDATEQIDAEEQIASILFDDPDVEISEDTASELGRSILLAVLTRFRPDLMEA